MALLERTRLNILPKIKKIKKDLQFLICFFLLKSISYAADTQKEFFSCISGIRFLMNFCFDAPKCFLNFKVLGCHIVQKLGIMFKKCWYVCHTAKIFWHCVILDFFWHCVILAISNLLAFCHVSGGILNFLS